MTIFSPIGALRLAARLGIRARDAPALIAAYMRRPGDPPRPRAGESVLRDKRLLDRAGVAIVDGRLVIRSDIDTEERVFRPRIGGELFVVSALRRSGLHVDASSPQRVIDSLYDQPLGWERAIIKRIRGG
ncbi:MAG: hypothetical protein IMX05_01385 [Hydrogenibacillus schlegelii]|nr:hypothetical protein [Hydrogenibacillus schlegelii]